MPTSVIEHEHSGILYRQIAISEPEMVDEEKRIIRFIGTTTQEDRYGDIVEAKGASLRNYHLNPVFLWSHKHDLLPIGKALSVVPKGEGLVFEIQFDDDEFSDSVYQKYRKGFLRAVSIGFIPLEKPEKNTPEIYQASGLGGSRYSSWELLELSAVTVPANPGALANSVTCAHCRATHAHHEETQPVPDEVLATAAQSNEELLSMVRSLTEQVKLMADAMPRGAVAHASYPLMKKSAPWDGSSVRAHAKAYATSADGNIDFGKYAKFFAYVIPGKEKEIGGYKLPHHDLVGGQIKTNFRGVVAAMARLHGMDMSAGDRKAVYEHLAKHYREFGMNAPDLKSYEEDDMFSMLKDVLDPKPIRRDGSSGDASDPQPYDQPAAGTGDANPEGEADKSDADVMEKCKGHLMNCMKGLATLHRYVKDAHATMGGTAVPADADITDAYDDNPDDSDSNPDDNPDKAAAKALVNKTLDNLDINTRLAL